MKCGLAGMDYLANEGFLGFLDGLHSTMKFTTTVVLMVICFQFFQAQATHSYICSNLLTLCLSGSSKRFF